MNRSTYYVDQKLLEKIKKGNKVIKTWSRNSFIDPKMIDCIFLVHNGRKFIKVKVTEEMARKRRKLGEFAITRRLGTHGKAGTQ